jgi:hypothetical protein
MDSSLKMNLERQTGVEPVTSSLESSGQPYGQRKINHFSTGVVG